MRDKSTGRPNVDTIPYPERSHYEFNIGPNSHPSKVQRWFSRGGRKPLLRPIEKIAAGHVHPRHMRRSA
jgi:hypothetical protein